MEITNTGGANIEVPEIKESEITYTEQLGRGCFGTVFLGECRGKKVAIKKLNTHRLEKKVLEEFKKEVSVLTHLRHPNVVLFMGACTEPGNMSIVTEYMVNGDAHQCVHNPDKKLTLFQILSMARDCIMGMAWLHASIPPIIHRDLKPNNLLVDEHYRVKICDFGLSAFQIEEKLKKDKTAPGTPLWMSPEVLSGETVTEKADLYAFGVVLWEMVTGSEPFSHHQDYSTFVKAIVGGERPPIPPTTHPDLAELLTECWDPTPQNRPSFQELIPRINKLLIDICVHDVGGSQFWLNNWMEEHTIPWAKFLPVFYKFLGEVPPVDREKNIKYKALLAVLSTSMGGNPVVTLERFGHVMGWFGPLNPNARGQSRFLDKLRDILSEDWFHGDITKNEAESVLLSWKKKGSYLVRLSITDPFGNPFTISMLNANKQVDHQRVSYSAVTKQYSTLVKVKGQVQQLQSPTIEVLIKRAAKHLDLKNPSPGSKYASIFSQAGGAYLNL